MAIERKNLIALKSSALVTKFLLSCLLIFFLSTCGFKPIYNDTNIVTEKDKSLYAIELDQPNSISEAEFYHHLADILPRKLPAKYLLKAQFNYSSTPIALQKNSDILRQTINNITNYQLLDIKTGKEVTAGHFRTISSYNAALSPFAAYVENQAALENMMKQVAEEMRLRLILYFKSKSS